MCVFTSICDLVEKGIKKGLMKKLDKTLLQKTKTPAEEEEEEEEEEFSW